MVFGLGPWDARLGRLLVGWSLTDETALGIFMHPWRRMGHISVNAVITHMICLASIEQQLGASIDTSLVLFAAVSESAW